MMQNKNARKSFLLLIKEFFTQRMTIMIIPHSEKKVHNMQISFSAMIFFIGLLFVMVLGVIGLSTMMSAQVSLAKEKDIELEQTQANLNEILEELSGVLTSAQEFDRVFEESLEKANVPIDTGVESRQFGDISDFVDVRQVSSGKLNEIKDLQWLNTILQKSSEPLGQLGNVLEAQNELLTDIPNAWPLQNGHGFVTLEFGPNRHPVTSQWYIHKGIDIAGSYGVIVLASANGKVIEAGYDRGGYGNTIVIRHKYGFKTRYSHLQNIYVTAGQEVQQSEPVGTLGNTGISTGPHLDFQITLGTDVVDPSLFLKIARSDFQRWEGNRY